MEKYTLKPLLKRLALVFGPALVVGLLFAACGADATATPKPTATVAPTATPARTPVPGVVQTAIQTASYEVELWTGPALRMMSMAFPIMSIADEGNPVNRHLEVHIFGKKNRAKVTDVVPVVRITNRATGVTRELADVQETGASLGVSFVAACQISKHRDVEPHFGDNIYLPDGAYTVTVLVGDETAVAEISF